MLLHDAIVASEPEGFSGAYIYCNKKLYKEVADTFDKLFGENWNAAIEEAEGEYDGHCDSKEDKTAPAAVIRDKGWEKADRLHVYIEPLFFMINDGVVMDNELGPGALEDAFESLKKEYPEIEYEGVIAYEAYDESGSEVINYEFCSDGIDPSDDKTYKFVYDRLSQEQSDEMFWERLSYQLESLDSDDIDNIMENLREYELPEKFIKKFSRLADTRYDELVDEYGFQ